MTERTIMLGKATDVGQRRDHNEDDLAVFINEDGWPVCVVADGMGGHQAGEVASKIAVTVLERELRPHLDDPSAALAAAIELANREILAEARDDAEKQGMGSTVVAAVLTELGAYLANAGDSPAYLVRDGVATQITHDHALVAEQVEAGLISPEDAAHHPFRHMLTRCLGVEDELEVETYPPHALQPGDLLILCSDGLTEHVTHDELGGLINLAASPDEIAEALVAVANARGGHDNITVVVARIT